MVLSVLQVDDADDAASAHERYGKECFVTVFGQFVKELEARIVRGFLGDGDGLMVFGDPSGNALPHAEFEAIDNFGMRILGGPQNQFVAFEHVDEARVTTHQTGGEFEDARENLVKSVGRTETHADFMEYIYMRIFYRDERVHACIIGVGESEV
jgi:hypothetical protein